MICAVQGAHGVCALRALVFEKFSFSEAKEGVGGQREVEIVSGTQSTNGYGHSIDERM